MYWIYVMLLTLISPLLLIHAWMQYAPPGRKRFAERLGRLTLKRNSRQRLIWVHAASVGEVNLSKHMIERLYNDQDQLLLTTSTATGAARAYDLFGERVTHSFIPYDLSFAVRRFLKTVQPTLVIMIETELWPTLYRQINTHKIPLVIANARISPKAFKWYQMLSALTAPTLHCCSLIAAQSEQDAKRFLTCGAPPERTLMLGNLKFDQSLDPTVQTLGQHLRMTWGVARPVFIAASTHDGEEAVILHTYQQLKAQFFDLVMIIAPRHPKRGDAIMQLLEPTGLSLSRRSKGETASAKTDIILADTLGELMMLYASADVGFIGGSLVNVGGHNPIEAALLKLPVVVGPQMFNFEAITERLLATSGLKQIQNANELAPILAAWLENPNVRQLDGQAAHAALDQHRGALDRHLAFIRRLHASHPSTCLND